MKPSARARCLLLALALATVGLGLAPAHAESRPVGLVVGAGFGVAEAIGDESAGLGAGTTIAPRVGYDLPHGLTPMLGGSYSSWGARTVARWELSFLPALRWTVLQERFAPWVEAAIGYGQLVHEGDAGGMRVDIGFRMEAALGFDYSITPWMGVGVHAAVDQIYGGGEPGYDSTWVGVGVGATLRPFSY